MIDISKWAFENKKLIYFLIAVLIVGGAYSSYEMSKLEDPEITVKLAMVVTTYPGASAHQVELEVTDVLEKNIRSMGNIDNVESYSYNDLSLIQVELKTTVKETDVEQCWARDTFWCSATAIFWTASARGRKSFLARTCAPLCRTR